MNFRKYGFNETNAQTYNHKKIFATKCGKKYNVYDAIQAANVDTDIKEVLKKYHCTADEAAAIMEQRGGIKGIYADIVAIQEKCESMADLMQFKDYVQNEFENLPLEMRQKYGNNVEEFLKNANKELQAAQQPEPKETTVPEGDKK